MDLNLEDNVALTTASSSGLGKASAKALAREGANVVVNGRSADRVEEAKSEILETATGEVIGYPGDITDPDAISGLVETTIDEFGGIDHLVISSGGPPRYRFPETTDQDWYNAYDLLVMSVVRTVRESQEYLEADGGGSIVNITSRSVKEASPTNVLSSSIRLAVIGLEKVLSKELGPEVRANAVLPGSIDTPRVEAGIQSQIEAGIVDSMEEGKALRAESIPIGRIGQPMELGDMVAFLCSERAAYINGETLLIDGGSSSSTL